jgi:hypothetical protein
MRFINAKVVCDTTGKSDYQGPSRLSSSQYLELLSLIHELYKGYVTIALLAYNSGGVFWLRALPRPEVSSGVYV